MTDLPIPPIGPEVDLTDFPFMPLDVRQLRDSKFASNAEGEAFRCGVLLWCAAWHQLPAGSLPDDDVELANLAGFGRMVKDWRRVRDAALYGWTKCSDGRLYHAVVVDKAREAWQSKLEAAYKRECDRLRKENKRRDENSEIKLPIPSFESWNSTRVPKDVRRNSTGLPAEQQRNSAARPADSGLKGQGRESKGIGTGISHATRERAREDVPRETSAKGTEGLATGVNRDADGTLRASAAEPDPDAFDADWLAANWPETANNARADIAIHHAGALVSLGHRTWAQLRANVLALKAYHATRGDPSAVPGMAKYFRHDDPERYWEREWPLAKSRAQQQQDANVDAGRAWLAGSA